MYKQKSIHFFVGSNFFFTAKLRGDFFLPGNPHHLSTAAMHIKTFGKKSQQIRGELHLLSKNKISSCPG
jgi:hypothetical protein